MIINAILIAAALVLLAVAVYSFRRLDALPDFCRAGLKKDVGLIMVWSVLYLGYEYRWVMKSYRDQLMPLDEYGWSAIELLAVIIFIRILYRLDICRLINSKKGKDNDC